MPPTPSPASPTSDIVIVRHDSDIFRHHRPTTSQPCAMMPRAAETSTTLCAATTAVAAATSSATSTPASRPPSTRTPTSTHAQPHRGPAITASRSTRTGTAATAAGRPAPRPRTCTTARPPRPWRLSPAALPWASPSTLMSPSACLATGTGAPSKVPSVFTQLLTK